MTNKQESYEKMSSSSVSYLLANATITSTLPNFTNYFAPIQTTLTQILALQALQEADRSGDTANKKLLRTTLIAQTIDICRRVTAYATNINNAALLALVDYSESDLKKSSDEKLVSMSQVVHDNANSNVTALATYGVTAAILTTQQASITSFNAAIPKVRVDTTDTGQITKQLENLFKSLRTNWDKIDTLVEMVRTSQPNFYAEYKKVRKPIDTSISSRSLKVKAVDAETGEGVANVTLTIIPVNKKIKLATANGNGNGDNSVTKKTAAGGGSIFDNLPDGDYNITAKKPGHKDVNLVFSVVNGESNYLEIIMEKA